MAKVTAFSELEEIPTESRWFRIYRALPWVTAIFEPYHFQEVMSFLIEGSERAVLFDSGMGIGNIKAVVDALTDLPVTLVNSHSHFDHVGGNWRFGETRLLDVPECVSRLEDGFSLPENDPNRKESAFSLPERGPAGGEKTGLCPADGPAGDENTCPRTGSGPVGAKNAFPDTERPWLDRKLFCVQPCRVIPMHDGDVFALGGRTLRVIAAPGHSADSIALADDENRILFTGDTVYPGPLYAFKEGPENVPVYAETVHRLAQEFSGYTLCCSHNEPVWEGSALEEIDRGFQQVLAERAGTGQIPGRGEGTEKTGEPYMGHTLYRFDGFSVVI